jgi:hypothetical protein
MQMDIMEGRKTLLKHSLFRSTRDNVVMGTEVPNNSLTNFIAALS